MHGASTMAGQPMKRIPKHLTAFLIFLFVANGNTVRPVLAETIRYPVYAGSFYPKDAEELAGMIEAFTQKAAKNKVTLPDNKQLRALILPHAGYMYSGLTAAHASHVLPQKPVFQGDPHGT